MARLVELKADIDAGKTVTTDVYGTYCGISKEAKSKRIYTSFYDGEFKRYNGFKALVKEWAWDEEEGEEGRWEIEPPLTEEEETIKNEFTENRSKLGLEPAYNLLCLRTADLKIKKMERELFQTKDKGQRNMLTYLIPSLRGLYKDLEKRTSA